MLFIVAPTTLGGKASSKFTSIGNSLQQATPPEMA